MKEITLEPEITLEELEEYRGLAQEMKALQLQIECLYDTYKSPQITSDGGTHSMSAGSPTETAVSRILELKEIYGEKYAEAAAKLLKVEKWLSTVNDPEISAIIRFHFLLNFSWQQTSTKVYGYPSYYNSRKRIMRYFGRES